MADLDTPQKRFSMMQLAMPWRGPAVVPTGTVDAAERVTFLNYYSGIALGGYTPPPVTPPTVVINDLSQLGGGTTTTAARYRQRTVVLSGADILIPLVVAVGAVQVRHRVEAVVTGAAIAIPLRLRVGRVRVERLADTEEEDVLALLGLLPSEVE